MQENQGSTGLQVITMLVMAVGLAAGVFQYWHANEQTYKQRIWSAQKTLYEQAIAAASHIANAGDLESVGEARREFWDLYWGNLAMLESPDFAAAMIKFGKALRRCEQAPDDCFQHRDGGGSTGLQRAAINIAYCARESLMQTWKPVDIGKLPGECAVS